MALAVAAVILIGGGAGQDRQSNAEGNSPEQSPRETGQPASTEQSPESREQASQDEDRTSEDTKGDGKLGTPTLGDAGAPVVMVEYSDYQ